MYTNIRSVQILINLLKKHEIKDIVLSPGGSDVPLIHSIETDDYFTCYSVVDERSAAYFTMGLAQESKRIAACICTSGTAVCNYLPGVTEAFYQNVPILVITADKDPYFQGQLETQKIDQTIIFNGVIKKSVSLPLIKCDDDEWLCNRLINEALLSLRHHGTGPAHINIPITGDTGTFDAMQLPEERCIHITDLSANDNVWKDFALKLSQAKRILIVVGQNINFSSEDIQTLNTFFNIYNCIYAVEHLSNLDCNGTVYTYPLTEMNCSTALNRLRPDIIISIGNNLAAYILKPFLRANYRSLENWLVTESGEVRDAYKSLTDIFECSVSRFFELMVKFAPDNAKNAMKYYQDWNIELEAIKLPLEFEFSNFYVAKRLSQVIPDNSLLHLAILNSTRIMQFFKLAKGVRTYSNVGALGIDGCFSTFVGQASATEDLAFLIIGDLSFFYDMNAAGLRSISSNVRIILLNNGGGSEFHFFLGKEKIPTIDKHICAEHNKTAEGWIRSLGYEYYSASTKDEFDDAIVKFGKKSNKQLFMEVFTKMDEDAELTRKMYKDNYQGPNKSIKNALKAVLSDKQIRKVKRIIQAIKE